MMRKCPECLLRKKVTDSSSSSHGDVPKQNIPTPKKRYKRVRAYHANKYIRKRKNSDWPSSSTNLTEQNAQYVQLDELDPQGNQINVTVSNKTVTDNQILDYNFDGIDLAEDNDCAEEIIQRTKKNSDEASTGSREDESNHETSTSELCTSESSSGTESEQNENLDEVVFPFEELLFDDSGISVGAACLLILKFCQKYKLPRKAQNDLLQLIRQLCPTDAAQKIVKTYRKIIVKTMPLTRKSRKADNMFNVQ